MKLISHVQPVICRSLDHDITKYVFQDCGIQWIKASIFVDIKALTLGSVSSAFVK